MSTPAQLLAALQAQFPDALTSLLPGDDYTQFYTASITTDALGGLHLHLLSHSPLQADEHSAALTALAAQHGASLTRAQADQSVISALVTAASQRRHSRQPPSALVTSSASLEGTAAPPKPAKSAKAKPKAKPSTQ